MKQELLFPDYSLDADLVADVRRMNPWWEDRPLPPLPVTRRHLVRAMHHRLRLRLAPIVVVRGPRQIGKTTAQLQVLQDLLGSGVSADCVLRVQCDELPAIMREREPVLRIVDWYERSVLKRTLNEAAHANQRTYIFLDEVQNLPDWAPQLKSLVDNSATQVVVTGSSALRIELGRDSLAGRITTIEAGVLSLTEIALFQALGSLQPFLADNGLEPLTQIEFWRDLAQQARKHGELVDQSFEAFSQRGGYPLVHQRQEVPWNILAEQLNETVIRRVIQHDLRIGERGRKRNAPLLEEVFRLACRYVGQSPAPGTFAREAQRVLSANIGPQRVSHYLRFLGDTLLLRLIQPLEIRLKRKRGSPKICLADHGLRASWLQEVIPLTPSALEREPHLTTLAGHLAESVAGATLSTISGLALSHMPPRGDEPEVDFVLTVGTRRVPLEVKYQKRIDPLRDTEGLRAFIEKTANNSAFGILVTQVPITVHDPRIVVLPLSSLMMLR
jgi:predicted AAA+ superfamily ATPase